MKYIMKATFYTCFYANLPATQLFILSWTMFLLLIAIDISLFLMVETYKLFSSSDNLFILMYNLERDCSVANALSMLSIYLKAASFFVLTIFRRDIFYFIIIFLEARWMILQVWCFLISFRYSRCF